MKERKRKRAWKGVPRGEGWHWQCGISYTVKDEERFPPFPTFLDFVTCLFASFTSFIGSLYDYIFVSLSPPLSMSERQSFFSLSCFWRTVAVLVENITIYPSFFWLFLVLQKMGNASETCIHELWYLEPRYRCSLKEITWTVKAKEKLTERKARDSGLP
jgi:hypothetical protein